MDTPDYDPFNPQPREEQRKTQSKKDENARALELADVLFVMGDPAGRRHIWRQLNRAGVYTPSYVAGDPYQTAFNEGQRNAGLRLLADVMEVAHAQYTQMLEEAKNA